MRTCLWLATASAIAVVLAGGTAPAGEKEKADAEVAKALGKIAQLGPGVHAIKMDKQGRITSCMIVGQARISTVLGKPKGLQDARTKARLDVSAQFVKWLKEKVSLHEKSGEETILFLEGSENNDEKALKESGKSIEKTSKTFESVSEGFLRGLQVLHVEVSDKDKSYALVMGWSVENAKAAEKVEKSTDSKDGQKGIGQKDGDKGSSTTKSRPDTVIGDRKITSDDAKKYLP